jgi:hypothetical protein
LSAWIASPFDCEKQTLWRRFFLRALGPGGRIESIVAESCPGSAATFLDGRYVSYLSYRPVPRAKQMPPRLPPADPFKERTFGPAFDDLRQE